MINRNGLGTLISPNGTVKHSMWRNDNKTGKTYEYYTNDGRIFEGTYSHFQEAGYGVFYYPDGSKYEVNLQYGNFQVLFLIPPLP